LYYNLCLCKSFKEHALKESASKVCHPVREAVISHLRVQRYAFSWNWQNISRLFSKKDAFSYCIHYILYTRAKENPCGKEQGTAAGGIGGMGIMGLMGGMGLMGKMGGMGRMGGNGTFTNDTLVINQDAFFAAELCM